MHKTKAEIIKGIGYLFSKINWGASFLDADAVQVMNTLTKDIQALAEAPPSSDTGENTK